MWPVESVRVKISGIRTAADALCAIECGADALGFLSGQTRPGPDFLEPGEIREILRRLPPLIPTVLISHRDTPAGLGRLIEQTGIHTIQIHSEMTPEAIDSLRDQSPGLTILKSYRVTGEDSLHYGELYQNLVDAFILDTTHPKTGHAGGTGIVHDWTISARIVSRYDLPFILAGGLTAENVQDAIATVRPFAVDVSTGVKRFDGLKDPARMRAFVHQAKAVRFPSPSC